MRPCPRFERKWEFSFFKRLHSTGACTLLLLPFTVSMEVAPVFLYLLDKHAKDKSQDYSKMACDCTTMISHIKIIADVVTHEV